MKCLRHPSAERLPRQRYCFLCQNTRPSYAIESDRNKFEREIMAQHVQPGVKAIRTHAQYQRLLKRHGLTDDIPAKELMDCAVDRAKRARAQEEGIHRVTAQLEEQMRHAMERPMPSRSPLRHRLERYLSR